MTYPTAARNDMVAIPGGPRERRLIHVVEPGQAVKFTSAQLEVRDLARSVTVSSHEVVAFSRREAARAFGTGWIAYGRWVNDTASPVEQFSAVWRVPPPPTSANGQLVYLFNSLQNRDHILQPVLEWGSLQQGGGPFWTVSSWYVGPNNQPTFRTRPIQVQPGQTLTGVISLLGQTTGGCDYNCEFEGLPGTGLQVLNIEEMYSCEVVLEAYGVTACPNYPNASGVKFGDLRLRTGGIAPAMTWSPHTDFADCQMGVQVNRDGAEGGEVEITYSTT